MLLTIIGHLPPTQRVPITATLGLVAIASILLFFLRSPFLSPDRALLGLAIICTGLAPGILYLAQSTDVRTPMPLMPLAGLFYAVFFGFPVFLADLVRHPETGKILVYLLQLDEISLEALVLVLIGTTLMFLSWSASKRLLWRRVPHIRLPDRFPIDRLRVLYWGLAGASLAYVVFPWLRSLPSIGQFLQPAVYVAFAGFYVLWKRGELPRWQAAGYFFCVLPIWAVKTSGGTLLTPLILLFVLWVALHFQFHDRVPWRTIAGLCLVILVVYPAAGVYRPAIWDGWASRGQFAPPGPLDLRRGLCDHNQHHCQELTESSAKRSVEVILRSVSLAYSRFDNFSLEELRIANDPLSFSKVTTYYAHGLITRISFILPLSDVVERTPDPVPYWSGETYKPFVSSWIPRVLWPGKPEERTGNAFGHRYALIHPTELNMSVNLPWITEMYANFGRAGVIAGMFVVGLMFGALEKALNEPGMAPVEWLIGAAVLIPLCFQESNFSVMTGSILPLVICLWLYFMVGLRLSTPRFLERFGG